jgi:NAD(P)-dependent dehydrogenase (short-subunit alcohol dehydrogenase family)
MENSPVVMISGASQGLGEAVATCLSKLGVAVSLLARSEKRLTSVADAITQSGGQAFVVSADVANSNACRHAVEATVDKFSRLDALVNCAGIVQPMANVGDADPEVWKYGIEVNLLGPFYLTHWALTYLRKSQGRVINVSSGAAHHVIEAASAYCAAKAGLNQFTSVLAAEEPGITAIAIRPGVVDTPMQAELRKEGPRVMPSEQAAFYLDLKGKGLLEPPLVPGRVIAWLALNAPREWSGRFLSYDDVDVKSAVELFFTNME